MKPKFEERTIVIEVAICPKCGHDLEVVTDPDLKTMMTYRCNGATGGEKTSGGSSDKRSEISKYCDYRY